MFAADLVGQLTARGLSVATAESLTGGLVASAIVDVPGASRTMRGGIVAYDTRAKHSLLGVNAQLLAERGAVDPDVAQQMAEGVRRAFTLDAVPADVGISTTGVAGPDPQDGQPVGTVFIAVSTPQGTRVVHQLFNGDRAAIREASVQAALELALDVLDEHGGAWQE